MSASNRKHPLDWGPAAPAEGVPSALSCAVLNKGAAFSLTGLPSPSSLRDATSPKVRGLGSPPSFRFEIFKPCCRKGSRQALRSDFPPLPRAPTLGELDAVRRPERASPAEAAQGLGLDCASDRAALPQGSAKPSAQLLVSILALSGASRQLSQRESFSEKGNLPVHPKPLTLGEVASRSDDGEGKPASSGTSPRFSLSLRQGEGKPAYGRTFVQKPQSPPLPFVQSASEL